MVILTEDPFAACTPAAGSVLTTLPASTSGLYTSVSVPIVKPAACNSLRASAMGLLETSGTLTIS